MMQVNLLSLGAVGLCSVLPSLAHRQGLFGKHGVDVTLLRVPGTEIPRLTGENPVAHISAPAALMRVAGGSSLKMLASFDAARLSDCLVVNQKIRTPQQLRGKRLGARVTGAALWIHTMHALQTLRLDPERDQITIAEIGDPTAIVEALEAGRIDGAVLSRPQSEELVGKGYSILFDLRPLNVYRAPDALVATSSFLQDHPDIAEGLVAALIESAAFALSPRTQPLVLDAIRAELALTDGGAADAGLQELTNLVAREPYPSSRRMHDMRQMMSASRPDVLGVSIEQVIDDRIVRTLDQSGFIDRTYVSYGLT